MVYDPKWSKNNKCSFCKDTQTIQLEVCVIQEVTYKKGDTCPICILKENKISESKLLLE